MKLINTKANHNKIKQTNLGKYRYFGQLIILFLCLTFIKTSFSIDVEDIAEFGSSKSEPIDSGFYFHEGKYIETPYIIERRGLNIYINDVLLEKGSAWSLYDYSVDTDPGDPHPDSSPLDPTPEGLDPRDSIWSKKFRYLQSQYDSETVKNMMFELYKKSNSLKDVHWVNSSKNEVSVVDIKTGMKMTFCLSNEKLNLPTKEELIIRTENNKQMYERYFQGNTVLFKKDGFSRILTGKRGLDTIEVLLSDVNDADKFKTLEEQGCMIHCEKAPWIITDFEASSQLRERVEVIKKEYNIKILANNTQNWLNRNRRGRTSTLDISLLESIEHEDSILQTELSSMEPNTVSRSILEQNSFAQDSKNNVSIGESNKLTNATPLNKNVLQIENTSHHLKILLIVILAIGLGIISLLVTIIHNRKNKNFLLNKEEY